MDLEELEKLSENLEIEAKLAIGKNGKGAIPESLWETYSSMANTDGGIILLGVEELDDGHFLPHNIENPQKLLKDFWNTINNQQKVSKNILSPKDAFICEISPSIRIIRINVPRASRKNKPVFLGNNPFSGTFLRNNDGDFHCPDHIIRQMLAEQTCETRDDIICRNYSLEEDIDMPTLLSFRQRFTNIKPDHVFNTYPHLEFLTQMGAYRKDRETKDEGLTLAGLLMFGKLRSILDNIPNYILDYQEQDKIPDETRWIDRVTTDFSWPGNLFSFYQIVIKRLFSDLKVPFILEGSTRIDDTPVHKAIREAFVNTLIHADYNSSPSTLIIKKTDQFYFRNSGTLRIPKADVFRGGISDCRNRNLQKMFQLVGLAEQAGSGFPKIRYGWETQYWKEPDLEEHFNVNQTSLALRMSSLLPQEAVDQASKELGVKFEKLSRLERLAVVTAYSEGYVNHSRLMSISSEHSSDITDSLHKLVQNKCLVQEGKGRGTIYYPINKTDSKGVTSDSKGVTSDSKGVTSDSKGVTSDSKGVTSDSKGVTSEDPIEEKLLEIVAPLKIYKRIPRRVMETFILELCSVCYLSLEKMSQLLQRDPKKLRDNFITPLCRQGMLERKYPEPNHPKQEYKTSDT